ncbi:sodium:proton antiporter [Caballeronia mineralivorans PML1(12)]|uniref:Sodium:proton antiporter n=1 Tax=Caballeronia mineralivorans PML1(12) TaxID=908627 RepID=A0A0J1CSV8_9BURK|nr:Na+/H+ antiporter [Caballeronia mineralivorans]KLU23707.1 sodium:proton antiporter [Caballeronia mineralivorans PML1(12)]
MSSVSAFKLVLLSLIVMIGLQLLAKRLRLPPAAALLVGGIAMAFVPGLPPVHLDPDLVIVVFLPPLLMDGAYFSVWEELKRNLGGILLLAIGAVAFTTLAVGVVTHLVVPGLPWAVCFALGAIVSPPDAVAAKAVLERLALPRKLMVLLEGESLLNDAAGLVLVRFAVAAALTGTFSIGHAAASFAILGLGGVVVGGIAGYLIVQIVRCLADDYLIITTSVLTAWVSYIVGEMLGVSGVIATVTAGLTLGWYQHEVLSATVRMRGTAFWQVIVFLLEALVFILIGLSLRGVIARSGGADDALSTLAPAVAAVLGAVVLSRFVWVFATELLNTSWRHIAGRGNAILDWRTATIMSWAGMRGVVTLAIALSLPEALPGRDLILVASFAVILVTVLLQGATIGLLIEWINPDRSSDTGAQHLTEPQAWARLEAAQLAAIEPLVRDTDGKVIHPRLLEQYSYRATITKAYRERTDFPHEERVSHYDVVLAAIAAGRGELLRMHRSGAIHDEMLHVLEHDLDLQEVSARHARG